MIPIREFNLMYEEIVASWFLCSRVRIRTLFWWKPMQFLHMEIYKIDTYPLSEYYVCHQEYLAEWLWLQVQHRLGFPNLQKQLSTEKWSTPTQSKGYYGSDIGAAKASVKSWNTQRLVILTEYKEYRGVCITSLRIQRLVIQTPPYSLYFVYITSLCIFHEILGGSNVWSFVPLLLSRALMTSLFKAGFATWKIWTRIRIAITITSRSFLHDDEHQPVANSNLGRIIWIESRIHSGDPRWVKNIVIAH
jgi:hypothetical protein